MKLWIQTAALTAFFAALASGFPSSDRARIAPLQPTAAPEPAAVGFDAPGDGRIWALGKTYKASFGAEGASYVPFLGSNAPRNFPATFVLTGADAGGAPLEVEPAVAPVRLGDAIEYRRGALVERYELALDGMEQTFHVLARPPAGELCIAIGVASELEPALDAHGLHLRNAWGGVDVSHPVAIDARGRRIELAWRTVEGVFEVRVPAVFLAAAAYPVIVDPWISTFALDVSPALDGHPDLCLLRGASGGTYVYMVAWDRIVSGTDADVWWAAYFEDGSIVPGTGAWADITSAFWSTPRLASIPDATLAGAATALLVAEVGGPGARHVVYGRERNLLGGATAQFAISDPSAPYDMLHPVVGGSDSPYSTNFCVVWERVYSTTDSDVHGRLVDKSGGVGASTIMVDDSGAKDVAPDISSGIGGWTPCWNVVWARQYSATDHDVYGAAVTDSGSLFRSTFGIEWSTWDDRRPCVSTPDMFDRSLVAWERDQGTDTDILGAAVAGTAVQTVQNLSQLDGASPSASQHQPDVDVDAGRYVVVYSEPGAPLQTDEDVRVSTFHLAAGPTIALDEGHVPLTTSTLHEFDPRLVCGWSDEYPVRSRSMVVYGITNGASLLDVGGATYELPIAGFASFCTGDGLGATPTTPCPCGNYGIAGSGCANSVNPYGAVLFASGTPFFDDVVLGALGMPATAACIYLQGDALDDVVFGDGIRCTGGTLLRLRIRANVGGASSFPDSTDTVTLATRGGVLPGSGDTRYYQTYYRNAAASFCPPATFNVTNGWQIVW